MSVSGYSIQHDREVQEYKQRRAIAKAAEKVRKQQEKILREQEQLKRLMALQQAEEMGIGKFGYPSKVCYRVVKSG
jgi:hypothetical protein